MSFTAYDVHEWLDAANVPHRLLRADGQAWSSEGGLADCRLDGAVIDSRLAGPGMLFVAAEGEQVHGVDYLAKSLQAGASAALVEGRIPRAKGYSEPVFLVEDARDALAALARGWLERWEPVVVGITGSNGKTTTKDMARVALGEHKVGANPGNLNSGYGLPLAVLGQPEGLESLVLEMGASEPGEIESLAASTQPRVGCITNIGAAHLEFFGSLDGVLEAKAALIACLPEEGCAILPRDDERYEILRERSSAGAEISFGVHPEADLRLEICEQEAEGLRVRIEGSEAVLPLFGEVNGLNAAAACAIALALDVTVDESLPRLTSTEMSPHRSRLLRVGGCSVLDDCYNANPSSMIAALDSLVRLPISGRRFAVLGSMAELGAQSSRQHAEIVMYARTVGVEEIYPVGEEMCQALGVADRLTPELSELGGELAAGLRKGDAVLFKGSRSVGLEQAVADLLESLGSQGSVS